MTDSIHIPVFTDKINAKFDRVIINPCFMQGFVFNTDFI